MLGDLKGSTGSVTMNKFLLLEKRRYVDENQTIELLVCKLLEKLSHID